MEHFCGWTLIDDDKLRPKEIFTPAGFPHNSSSRCTLPKKEKKKFFFINLILFLIQTYLHACEHSIEFQDEIPVYQQWRKPSNRKN